MVRTQFVPRIPRACVGLVVACITIFGCGSSKNVDIAKQAVEMFHAQVDTEQYNAVYVAADEKFHQATTEADFSRLLDAVHRKLGPIQHSDLRGWRTGWYAGQGATVTLTYDTTFATGKGTEQFLWHISGDQALLYGYHINSNDLVTN